MGRQQPDMDQRIWVNYTPATAQPDSSKTRAPQCSNLPRYPLQYRLFQSTKKARNLVGHPIGPHSNQAIRRINHLRAGRVIWAMGAGAPTGWISG